MMALLLMAMLAQHARAEEGVWRKPEMDYVAKEDVAGSLRVYASKDMEHIIHFLLEDYVKLNARVHVDQVEAATDGLFVDGPRTGLEKDLLFAFMDVDVKGRDTVKLIAEKLTQSPISTPICLSVCYVIINKENGTQSLSFAQFIEMFFESEKGNGQTQQKTWAAFTSDQSFVEQTINRYTHSNGTAFAKFVQAKSGGGVSPREPSRRAGAINEVVDFVAQDRFGIGYTGAFACLRPQDIRILPITFDSKIGPINPTVENCMLGKYPLRRIGALTYIPDGENAKLHADFTSFARSRQGAQAIKRGGGMITPLNSD